MIELNNENRLFLINQRTNNETIVVNEVAGPDWLDPDWFRFGASTLLNDLLMQRIKLTTGRYTGPDYVTVD